MKTVTCPDTPSLWKWQNSVSFEIVFKSQDWLLYDSGLWILQKATEPGAHRSALFGGKEWLLVGWLPPDPLLPLFKFCIQMLNRPFVVLMALPMNIF